MCQSSFGTAWYTFYKKTTETFNIPTSKIDNVGEDIASSLLQLFLLTQ